MLRGHLSAFLGSKRRSLAILEVDEAVLPLLLPYIAPRCIVLHNLFRDQLDRYGEVDSTARKWLSCLEKNLTKSTVLLVNGDDPNLAHIGYALKHDRIEYYGIDDAAASESKPVSVVDAYLSPVSGEPLRYSRYYMSHLGVYTDPASDFKRPELDLAATDIKQGTFSLSQKDQPPVLTTLPLPGLYNVYNALAAAHAALVLGISLSDSAESLAKSRGVFGRYERINVLGHELVFCLIKNPVGATEVMRTVAEDVNDYSLAFLANDRFADGQDVSWYWDSGFELLAGKKRPLYCGGLRAFDLAVRLKYAGYTEKPQLNLSVPNVLNQIVASLATTTYVLCTYTATLEAQAWLTKHGHKSAYWKE